MTCSKSAWLLVTVAAVLKTVVQSHSFSMQCQTSVVCLNIVCCGTVAGFHPIPALESLEGLLNSLAPAQTTTVNGQTQPTVPQLKPQALVQHRGSLGFLQGFLKLQQAMAQVLHAKDQSQVC